MLTFNFFFTEPRFSLHAYDSGYPVTFLVMFLASPAYRLFSIQTEVPCQTICSGSMAYKASS
ncbi:MAG: DUF4118 domain-containing protein [Oscillospiraceae bacterium]